MKQVCESRRCLAAVLTAGSVLAILLFPVGALASNAYGSGAYGTCQYNSCGITLTSSGTVADNVAPGLGTTCTVQSDSVSVTTDSSTGYSLSLNDGAANSRMNGSNGGVIAAGTGTSSSPAMLAANQWGYRVDGLGGFGSGPTTASTNGSIPPVAFAGVPNSLTSPDVIVNSANPADPAVTTPVWYGVCANTAIPNGTYSSAVTYTAVVN